MKWKPFLAAAAVLSVLAGPAAAASCGGDYKAWLAEFKAEAARHGISQRTLNAALDGVTPDPQVLRLDRNQGHFRQSFETFRSKRVPASTLQIARSRMKQNANLLKRIEQRYGVPGEVIVAIWGLETAFGAGTGKMSVIRSLTTLAHDCRRSAFFQNELIAALSIVDRGDMPPSAMRGGWAGEVGQTQFLASSYVKYAVDFDGDGRRDLIRSTPDALASTANFLKAHGWRAGQPWDEGTHNYGVLTGWNKAEVYRRTIAWFANQLAGR